MGYIFVYLKMILEVSFFPDPQCVAVCVLSSIYIYTRIMLWCKW